MQVHAVFTPEYAYHNYLLQLQSLAFLDEVDTESGAAGPNREWARTGAGHPNVRLQEVGEFLICEGLVARSPRRMTIGVHTLSFGLGLQHPDGAFPQYARDDHSYAGSAFFACAVEGGLLMLAAKEPSRYDALRSKWSPHLARAALWLASHTPDHPEMTNQTCAAAAAATMLSAIQATRDVMAASRRLCSAALEIQDPDGSWPECGGTDSVYQAISLIYATYAFLACHDEGIRAQLRTSLDKGFRWMADRVGEDGSLDCSRNTRKTPDRVPPDNGAISASDVINCAYAFRTWAEVTNEPKWRAISERVRGWIGRSVFLGPDTWTQMLCGLGGGWNGEA